MVRHAIDRIEFLAIEGWALGADGSPPALGLWHDGAPLAAAVEWVDRPDVQAHFGGVALRCGFVLRPDGAAWAGRFGFTTQRCELRIGAADPVPVELGLALPELAAWADTVADLPPGQERDAERSRLQPLAALAPASAELRIWLERRWAEGPPAGAATVRGSVERIEGLRLVGWASDTGAPREQFTVHCHTGAWPVRAQRLPREDVRQAVPGAGPQCGFELDLPSDIWAATGPQGDAWVQLRVNGHALWPRPQRVPRASVVPALQAALAASSGASDAAGPGVLASWRRWALIEHAWAAGLWNQLPRPMREAVRQQFSDEDWRLLQGALGAQATAPAQAETSAAATIWALQQAFNERLAGAPAGPAQRASALVAALDALKPERSEVPVPAWQAFVAGLVPAFCAAGALPALRPHLSEDRLAWLQRQDDRWHLSLVLPVRLRDELPHGHLSAALSIAERLAVPQAGGWLNTEALWDAVTTWQDALATSTPIDGWQAQRFAELLVDLWDALGADPFWSRLPDDALLRGQWALLRATPWLDETVTRRVVDAALRHYGVLPAFWRMAAQHGPAASAMPPELLRAARAVLPVFERLVRGDPVDFDAAARELLAWARDRQVGQADALQRQALIARRAAPDEARAWRLGLPAEDDLRLPLNEDELAALWPRLEPEPPASHANARAAAWQALERAHAGAADADTASLVGALGPACDERAGFAGLVWAAQVARRAPAGSTLRDAAVGLLASAMPQAFAACGRRPQAHPQPPAALCALGTALLDWSADADADAAAGSAPARLLDTWKQHAQAVWNADGLATCTLPASPPSNSSCLPSWPGAGVLVVARRCAATVPSALASTLPPGVDLCRWVPQGDAAQGPGEGSGAHVRSLHAPTLFSLLQTLLATSAHAQFFIVDDDAEPAWPAWIARTGVWSAHYHGSPVTESAHRVVLGAQAQVRLDASPEGTPLARVATGLGLSRQAAAWALDAMSDPDTPVWATLSPDEEKRLAQLLSTRGVALDARGQWWFHARLPDSPRAELRLADRPPPGAGSPTVGALGDAARLLKASPMPGDLPRIWPTDRPPRLRGAEGSQQLVRLRDPFDGAPLAPDEVGVFAVARNERVLMPHFLAHYRALGVRRFVLADNLSCDGTREYLMSQPDVTLYSVDTPYKLSHYGVAWQQAMLAEHALGRWALVVDIDEFLVWPGCEGQSLAARCAALQGGGHDAALALMIDMYPEGTLDAADFERGAPFAEAPCFDAAPVRPWRLGSGSYSNSPTWVSNARHRLLPGSAPNHYTAQKVMLVRYQPFVRWSEGLHYAAGVQRAPEPLFLAHFKYHRGFRAKVEEEVARRQHYNDAEEYRKYRALWAEARGIMFDPAISRRYVDSTSFADIPWN
jgi:hypothetical protein